MSAKNGTGKEEKPTSRCPIEVSTVGKGGSILREKLKKKMTTLKVGHWSIYTLASFPFGEGTCLISGLGLCKGLLSFQGVRRDPEAECRKVCA